MSLHVIHDSGRITLRPGFRASSATGSFSAAVGYDSYQRPTTLTYPDGEVITTTYGSPGAPVGTSGSVHGALVDSVSMDEAGRMTAMRYPAGGNLWHTRSYYGWRVARDGGQLQSLKVGLSQGGGERFSRGYSYNGFGDIASLTEGATTRSFSYDGLGRLTNAYGRAYAYEASNRITSFAGQSYSYQDAGPYHGVDRIGGVDRYDYDANGGRVRKTSGITTTYSFFPHYEEEEVAGSATTAIRYYSFNGQRIAVKRGGTLSYLHRDHLSSSSLATAAPALSSVAAKCATMLMAACAAARWPTCTPTAPSAARRPTPAGCSSASSPHRNHQIIGIVR